MAEADGKEPKDFHLDTPAENHPFFLKGSGALGWGMQNRLSRIFRPDSGRTVMLAIDHGYFQGPTTGLERVDVNIVPLLPGCDALMLTRGMLRSTIPAGFGHGVVLRASGGPSILKELSNEQIAVDMEDAARLNVAAVAVQVFIGGEHEAQSIHNMTRLVDQGSRYGIPVLAVTAVGKEMVRNARYFRLACRMCAELGAHIVKTYYVPEDFETVTASCPVPVVMAGGKKLPELEALTMAYNAVDQGASGVDMGRNIFQSDAPAAMLQAVGKVVHEKMQPAEALELYRSLKRRMSGTAPERAVDLLRRAAPTLSVGVLTADLMSLGADLARLERSDVPMLHVDVMDGSFCPMITVGPPFIAAMRTPLLKDAHLMISEPLEKVDAYVAAGADIVTVHAESCIHIHRVLQHLGKLENANDPARGLVRGLALNPGTPLEVAEPLLDQVEMVMLLAVNPGWGGQSFIPSTLPRAKRMQEMIARSGREILLAVDGGIKKNNIGRLAGTGIDIVVTGSAVYDGGDPAANAAIMLEALRSPAGR